MSGNDAFARAALRAEAVQWFNLERSGDMTVDDEFRFLEWLDQSDAHRDTYRLVERAWLIAGTIPQEPEMLPPPAFDADGDKQRSGWRRHLALAASLLLVVTLGWSVYQRAFPGLGTTQDQHFRTGVGQTTTVTLPEGSVVTLDAETEMRLRETPRERRVDLIGGRAFFRVASDRSRPFTVNAGGKSVRAIGTAFEVSFEHGNMVVTLAEGKVRVEETGSDSGSGTDMAPGGQLVIGADRNWTLSRVDVAKETSWTEGRLIFMRDPLSEAVAEMNRYSPRKLVFQDGEIPEKQVVGVFQAGDVDGFVKAMELNGIARRISATDDQILLSGGE